MLRRKSKGTKITTEPAADNWDKERAWATLTKHDYNWPSSVRESYVEWLLKDPENLPRFNLWEKEWADSEKAKVTPEVKQAFREELDRWVETKGLGTSIPLDTYQQMRKYLVDEELAGRKITQGQLLDDALQYYLKKEEQK